jgi:ribose 5-phosphate isomerase A
LPQVQKYLSALQVCSLMEDAIKRLPDLLDYRKLQKRLLSSWKTIPIEVLPMAASTIEHVLISLGSPDPKLRQGGTAKAGPVVTDNGNWIIDAPFPPLLIPSDLNDGNKGDGKNGVWEVHALGERLNRIVGVMEVGLFHGLNGIQVAKSGVEGQGQKPVAAYFGMENGEVEVRVAKEVEGVNMGGNVSPLTPSIPNRQSSLVKR